RADKRRPGLLYAGTEYGMYVSFDDGAHWKPMQLNLPIVPVTDMTIKDNSLVVATQGRAFWVLDDLGLVQQLHADSLRSRLHVFSVDDAWRFGGGGGRRNRDRSISNAGQNPPSGVVVQYWIKDAPDTPRVSITVFDKKHEPIRTFSTHSKETDTKLECHDGINTFVWDMLYPPAVKVPGMLLWTGGAGTPMAAPGRYSVRVRYGHDSAEVPFVIKADPNFSMSEADYDAQVGFLLQVRDKYNAVQRAVLQIRSIRGQLQALNGRLDSSQEPVRKLSDSVIHQLTAIEEALYQTKSKSDEDMLNYPIRINDKLSGLYGIAAGGYAVPTRQAREVFAELSTKADTQLDRLKSIISDQLAALNKLIYERQVPVISTKTEDEGEK
ncbi:MAG TPA: hypothetical protein VGR89_06650, partial [Puia sp.]|nr:hypothetical protein [Puia sp.]